MCEQALAPGAKLGDWTPSAVHEARAYANFKLGRYMEAVQDAGRAVQLDPSNVKAYLRKGCVALRCACWQGFAFSPAVCLRLAVLAG